MARSGLVLTVLLTAGFVALCSSPAPTVLGQGVGQFSPQIAEGALSLVYLPLVDRDDRRGDWINMLDEDFEGPSPLSGWVIVDQNNPETGVYFWEESICQAASGSHSAWAIGGGEVGGQLKCGDEYPLGVYSWMTYGPVDLSDATRAELRFKRWVNTVGEGDSLQYLASANNNHYEGFKLFGATPVWRETVLDLTQVPVLGNLTGQSQVWIRFVFETKDPNSRPEGAFVDDIILRRWVPEQGQAP